MFARVVTFAGGDPTRIDEVIATIRDRFAPDAPDAVAEAEAFYMLVDRKRAHILGVTLFEDRDKLRRGMKRLDDLPEPAPEAGGRRVAVEAYEVPVSWERARFSSASPA
jgi:hypothetical protein